MTAAEAPEPTRWRTTAPLAGSIAAYAAASIALSVASLTSPDAASLGVAVFAVLLVALALAGVFSRSIERSRFYLATSVLVVFTLVRIALLGALTASAQVLLSYVVLAGSLALFQSATRVRIRFRRLTRAARVRVAALAIPLGAGFGALEALLVLPAGTLGLDLAVAAVVAVAIAFLDEYWFRGVLQSQLEGASTPTAAWIGTAVLFVAASAPTTAVAMLALRAALGLVLGYCAGRYRLLQLSLIARTLAAASAIVLSALLPRVSVLP